MKKLFLIITLLTLCHTSYAGVDLAMTSKSPKITGRLFQMQHDLYLVEFELKNIQRDIKFNTAKIPTHIEDLEFAIDEIKSMTVQQELKEKIYNKAKTMYQEYKDIKDIIHLRIGIKSIFTEFKQIEKSLLGVGAVVYSGSCPIKK